MPPVKFGAHLGQQNLKIDEIRALWRRFDSAGLDWISLWDHFYEAPPAGGTQPHFEAISLLGALATETKRAQIGCLVFYPGYRNPAALAKAATTIDHLSGGRFNLGLGAGWHEWEAPRLRLRLPAARHAHGDARRGAAHRPRPAHPGAHDLRGQALQGRQRVVPARAAAAAAADLGRRPRREEDAAARGASRRRLERGVRLARRVRAPRHGARRLVREGRPRSQ